MDHYPQPRPVLYGTHDEETPAQTQTAPVVTGPPRYPPAPPWAGEADGPGEPRWHNYLPASARSPDSAPGRFVVAALYALASVYALYQVAILPQAFAELPLASRLLLLLQIVAALWVVPCLSILQETEYLVALGISLFQLLLALVAGEWSSPGLLVALIACIYLLRPSLLVTPRASAVWRSYSRLWCGSRNIIKRTAQHRKGGKHFSRPIPDNWKIRW